MTVLPVEELWKSRMVRGSWHAHQSDGASPIPHLVADDQGLPHPKSAEWPEPISVSKRAKLALLPRTFWASTTLCVARFL